MVECPYHHKRWRGGLQCVVNGLRGTVLHQRHVRQFPVAVCACADCGRSSVPGGLDTLVELQRWLKEESQGNESLAKVCPTLEKFLAAGGNESLSTGTREALIRVVTLVRELYRGNFSRVEPSLQCVQATGKEGEEEEFPLPLPSTYLGVFLGSGGRHIKSLCKEHNVKAHLGEKGTRFRGRITGSVKVTVSSQGGDVAGFKAALQKRVEEVTRKKEEHKKNVENYWKYKMDRDRKRWQGRLDSGRQGPGGAYHNPKEAARREFERKQQRSKPRGSDSKPSFAALSDGRCLHCLAPYTSGQMQEGACKYHRGFLVAIKPGKEKGFKWTCCNKRTVATHPTHELHRKTGCSTGRHVWRAGKPMKLGKEPPSRGTGSSDFYVR